MKKQRSMFVLLLGVMLLLAACRGSINKSYSADRYDVDLTLGADNTMLVTETVQFRFVGGSFSYVYRDITLEGLDSVDQIEASMDGVRFSPGQQPGQVEIEQGDSLRITWHFAPLYDAAHTFTLRYRVQGAVRQQDNEDVLRWYAIPEDHAYEIAASTVTLTNPPANEPLAAPRLLEHSARADTSDGRSVLTAGQLDEDEGIIIEARFTGGSLLAAPPRWQAEKNLREQYLRSQMPVALAAGGLTLLIGLGWLVQQTQRFRRPRLVAPHLGDQTTPPSALPPAVAVHLAKQGYPGLAATFDLAQRGVVTIDEAGKTWGMRSFVLRRQATGITADLRPHETGLLTALFTTKKGQTDELPLRELGTRLAAHHKLFDEPLDEEMELAGLLDPQRKAEVKRLLPVTLVALFLGGAAGFVGLITAILSAERAAWSILTVTVPLAVVGFSLSIVGFIAMITVVSLSTRTREGEEQSQQWRRFGDYLKQVARGKVRLDDPAAFERYLPYAAGFGLGESWMKRYQQETGFVVPPWFQALQADDASAAFIAVMAASNASFHSSSGGGGAGGAGGGGGSGAG